jgi:hypothetical protein
MRKANYKVIKKTIALCALTAFVFSQSTLALANPGSLAADYLCEIARSFYNRGQYEEALHEFRKTLLISPNHKEANYYIKLLTEKEEGPAMEKETPVPLPVPRPAAVIPKVSITKPKVADRRLYTEEEFLRLLEGFRLPSAIPSTAEKISEETISAQMPVIYLPKPEVIRKGEIGLFINGEEVSLNQPILIKEGRPLVPLRELCAHLFYNAIDLKEGNFRLISPEGALREIKVPLVDNEPVLDEKQIQEYFSVDTRFDYAAKAFYLKTRTPIRQFKTYALEKSAQELKKEKQEQEVLSIISHPPEKPAYIPKSALPSIDLRGDVTYTYIKYHTAPVFHSLTNSLYGKFYDFDLSYQSAWKDINGVFNYDYSWLNLNKPDLFIGLFNQYSDLYPLRLQTLDFNGLKIVKAWDKSLAEASLKSTFVGGDTENTVSGSAGQVKYLGRVYGLKQDFSALDNLKVKTGIFYLENKADIPALSGTTSFPRNNILTYSDLSLELPYDFTVSSALAHSNYHPDNAPDSNVQDLDWRTGLDLNKPRGKFGLAYEVVGDRYVSFGNPLNYQDYKGWNLYGNYRVTDKWSIFTYANRYRNNIHNEDRVTTYVTSLNASSYHQLTKEQSANLSFNQFVSDPSGPNAGPSSATNIYRIDYFLPFFFSTRAIANYQFSHSDSGGDSNNSAVTRGGSLFKSFGRGSSWYLSQQLSETFYKTASDTRNLTTSFNINYVFMPLLSAYLNANYTRDKEEGQAVSPNLSAATGLRYKVTPLTNLYLEYNVNSYNLKTERDRWPRNWSILFYISQAFNLSTPLNFGIVEGRVIKDINENGRVDNADVGSEGALLYLEDKRETVADSKGNFRFLYVEPGSHRVTLDLSSVAPEWTLKGPEKEIEVKARKKNKMDFILSRSSTIKGKVFIDSNGDLIFQDNEEPLENIIIELLPQKQFTHTDSEGQFKFDYLLQGEYQARINLDDIPLGYELSSPAEITLDLAAGKEIKDINFALRLKTTPISK